MDAQFSIGLIIGFASGAFLVAGIFYTLYLQVSDELLGHVSDIKKTLGYFRVRLHEMQPKEKRD